MHARNLLVLQDEALREVLHDAWHGAMHDASQHDASQHDASHDAMDNASHDATDDASHDAMHDARRDARRSDAARSDAARSDATRGVVFEDGALTLAPGSVEGVLESPAFTLPAFTELVASWNSSTPPGTFVELAVQVRTGGGWSRWFTYGRWADGGANTGSVPAQRDEHAVLDVDLLRVLNGTADAVRFRLHLGRTGAGPLSGLPTAPRVRLVAFTYAPAEPSGRPYVHENITLNVPARAQLPVPNIGRIICSPTSLAMVMQYYGHEEATEDVAAGAKDNGAGIYGNWSYNAAYAGEKGFTAWVERCDSFEDVKDYLKSGVPVVASIRTAKDDPLPGAVMPYPAGHLLVITGLTEEDGQRLVLVNDPAAHTEDDVPRRYPLDRFLQTWRNVIYVVQR